MKYSLIILLLWKILKDWIDIKGIVVLENKSVVMKDKKDLCKLFWQRQMLYLIIFKYHVNFLLVSANHLTVYP